MNSQTWQNALDPRLVRRLLRPLVQPGVIDSRLATSIIARTERMTNRLPLLVHLAQRQAGVAEAFQGRQTPIAYAQPSSMVDPPADSVHPPSHPAVAQTATPVVIQAKFADSIPSSDSLTHRSSLPDLPFIADARSQPDLLATSQTQPPIAHAPSLPLHPNVNSAQPSSLSASQSDAIHSPVVNPIAVQAQFIRPTLPVSTEDLSGLRSPLAPDSSANAQVSSETTRVYAQPIGKNTHDESPVQRLNQSMISGWSNANGELRSPPVSPAKPHPVVRVSNGANPSAQPNRLEGMFNQPLVFSSPPVASASHREAEIGARGHQDAGTEHRWNTHEIRNSSEIEWANTPSANRNPSTMMAQTNEPLKAMEPIQPPVDLEALASKVERKLMRRLVVESERRGQGRWR